MCRWCVALGIVFVGGDEFWELEFTGSVDML